MIASTGEAFTVRSIGDIKGKNMMTGTVLTGNRRKLNDAINHIADIGRMVTK